MSDTYKTRPLWLRRVDPKNEEYIAIHRCGYGKVWDRHSSKFAECTIDDRYSHNMEINCFREPLSAYHVYSKYDPLNAHGRVELRRQLADLRKVYNTGASTEAKEDILDDMDVFVSKKTEFFY